MPRLLPATLIKKEEVTKMMIRGGGVGGARSEKSPLFSVILFFSAENLLLWSKVTDPYTDGLDIG